MKRIELDRWSVMQDVLLQGLPMHIYEDGTDFGEYPHLMSDFIGIDHLGYLQKIFSSTPYFGKDLRLFNAYPWWYRCRFEADEALCSNRMLRLCFTSADYRASVYLNGQHIGTHEGYSSSFSFDVTSAIHVGMNALYVMVEAPWDQEISPGSQAMRCFSVRRRMVKGTYEHGDGFIQRDVNPIGLVGPVFIETYDSAALSDWRIDADGSGFLRLRFHADGISDSSCAAGAVTDKEGRIVGTFSAAVKAENDIAIHIPDPHLWSVWDRGEPYLYGLHVEVQEGGNASAQYDFRVGFRDTGMIRTSTRTEFLLNGKRIFLRGTSYFPDVYTQDIPCERYLRDLRRMKEAGFNAIRVHVHVEQDMFYDLCDEMGFIVFQDSDFSWNHPSDPEWLASAFPVFDAMVMKLSRHPSVSCWILLNEPDKWKTLVEAFGKSLDEIAKFAEKHDVNLAINLGTSSIKKCKDDLPEVLKTAEIVIMNLEEAQLLTGLGIRPDSSKESFSNYFIHPDIVSIVNSVKTMTDGIVVITDGKNGVYAYDDKKYYRCDEFPAQVVSTLGAGDAFASTFVAVYDKTVDIKQSLLYASVNAASVVEHFGAQKGFLTFDEIKTKLVKYPNFVVKESF